MALAIDKYLTTDEVAERLRISRMRVIQLIDLRELPAMRVGRLYRIREADLLEFINRNMTVRPDGPEN